VELTEHGLPVEVARRDIVEPLLHPRRELHVDNLWEASRQIVVDGEAKGGRHERTIRLSNVPALLDRRQDLRVCRRAPDPRSFECAHE
jgi:hypothetical protein